MATLTVRNLPEHVREWLRERAARSGRSVEAEALAILLEKCEYEPILSVEAVQEWVDELYGANKPKNVVESFIADRPRESGE